MSNELVKQELHEILEVPAEALPLLSPIQQGWLRLAAIRNKTFDDLTKDELAIQGELKDIEKETNLEFIQERIKKAKNLLAKSKEQRLHFTNMLKDKIIDKSMEFEKRSEEIVRKASDYELAVRKREAEKQEAGRAKSEEVAALTAHIKNEYLRIGAAYRIELGKLIHNGYTYALQGKYKGKVLKNAIASIEKFMREQKLEPFQKFDRKLVSQEEAAAIFKEIPKYDPANDLAEYLDKLKQKFAMYDQDLENAEEALKAQAAAAETEAAEEQERLEIEAATNSLMAQANSMSYTGEKQATVKRSKEIVEENTQQWGLSVMTHFIANINLTLPHVKVKTWSKLTVAQMAAALEKVHNETGNTFANLSFKDKVK